MTTNPIDTTSKLPEEVRREISAITAELRHAYSHLAVGRVVDQRSLANGLLAPQIRRLEALYSGAFKSAAGGIDHAISDGNAIDNR